MFYVSPLRVFRSILVHIHKPISQPSLIPAFVSCRIHSRSPPLKHPQRLTQRQHLGSVIQPIAALGWGDHQQAIELQIRWRLAHGGAQPGGIGPLDLHADAPSGVG